MVIFVRLRRVDGWEWASDTSPVGPPLTLGDLQLSIWFSEKGKGRFLHQDLDRANQRIEAAHSTLNRYTSPPQSLPL